MSSSLIRDVQFVRKTAETCNAVLSEEACKVVAFEVEYTLRLIIQNATKYSKHFNRETIKIEDINFAIRDLNIFDTSYGYEDMEQIQYKREMDFWYVKPKPRTRSYSFCKNELVGGKWGRAKNSREFHIQYIEDNTNNRIASMREKENLKALNETVENKDMNLKNILIKEVSDNLLSKELQMFLNSVVDLIKTEESTIDNIPLGRPYKITQPFKKMLQALRENQGLNNIIPFLTNYIYQQHDITNVNGIVKKINLAKIILACSFNTNFNLEAYLHILIKILLTFVTSNKLSLNERNNEILPELHIRDLSAKALVSLIVRYEEKYFNLKYNVANTLMGIFDKEATNYSTLYGIIRVFYYFDANIIQNYFLKKLSAKFQLTALLENVYNLDQSESEKQKTNPIIEVTDVNKIMAKHVYTALLEVCSRVIATIPIYSSKSYYESYKLYSLISEIFGEACLICPSSKGKLRVTNQIMPIDDKKKNDRYAYLNYII